MEPGIHARQYRQQDNRVRHLISKVEEMTCYCLRWFRKTATLKIRQAINNGNDYVASFFGAQKCLNL